MKLNFFILTYIALCCSSCISIKVKEAPIMYSTQALQGKILKINIINYIYPARTLKKDIEISTDEMFFDANNKKTKEIETFGKVIDETTYFYNKNRLSHFITKRGNTNRKIEYVYDKKGRVIVENNYSGEKLSSSKKSKYDTHGNPINIVYSSGFNNWEEIRKYNYKSKTILLKQISGKENEILFMRLTFDNKGYIIKSSDIQSKEDAPFGSSMEFKYDEKGNLLEKKLLGGNGKTFDVTIYQNTFDEKDNILSREIFWNSKLVEKTNYNITYKK